MKLQDLFETSELNGYIAYYKGKQTEVFAETSLLAQQKAAIFFKAKKSYDVTVVLAQKAGVDVKQDTSILPNS